MRLARIDCLLRRMSAWNHWYHVSGHTYGSWLRGDPRGWRARHHREHVEGDYRNPPPPGTYDTLLSKSKSLMKRAPVRLSPDAREVACEVFAEVLRFHQLEPLIVSVDVHHYHVLARFKDSQPRKWIGIAKKRSARSLSDSGLVEPGGVWAVRCKCLPIKDRAHQVAAYAYILRHGAKGARVWTFKQERSVLTKRKPSTASPPAPC